MSFVTNYKAARKQILNTQTKKAVRPTPWNIQLEVTPQIIINVGGYSSTRKNKISEMSRVLLKQVDSLEETTSNDPKRKSDDSSISSASSGYRNNSAISAQSSKTGGSGVGKKTVVVEQAKNVLEKETVWTENDGTVVSEDEIGKAYYFGDRLVPYNGMCNENEFTLVLC